MADPASEYSISASGRDSQKCSEVERSLMLQTYREVLASEKQSPQPLALTIHNEIPIGKGCGSSATARLAGIALANHFGGLAWNSQRILEEAARREGHADNVAACWLGGFVIVHSPHANAVNAASDGSRNLRAFKIPIPRRWPLLLVVPTKSVPTHEARRVLPVAYSREQAVTNIQSSMLLALALAEGRGDLLSTALYDCLHEPFRAALFPWLTSLRRLNTQPEVLGVVLSGAGPSILFLLHEDASTLRIKKLIASCLAESCPDAELIATEVEPCGGADSLAGHLQHRAQPVREATSL
jgi:homoserine kinase